MAPRITRLTCHAGELVGSYSKRHAVSFRLRRFVRQEFQVLFHSPRRGTFHRSLTVLCAIGRQRYLALDRGRPGFRRDLACPAVLEIQHPRPIAVADGALTRYGSVFQTLSADPQPW